MQVYGAGGKTVPKRGRNGTGSYYPGGTPLFLHKGNTFAGIQVIQHDFAQLTFGEQSRAAIATGQQNRVQSKSMHPNLGHYNINTIPLCPAMVVGSSNDDTNLQPVNPARVVLVMPHERNSNSAEGRVSRKPQTYRTVFGASKTMPVDSAFQRDKSTYKQKTKAPPKPAHEAVKVSTTTRTFAKAKGPVLPQINHRTPPPSFVSRGNQWFDPHNSFQAGATTLAGHGVGRWGIVKKGVIDHEHL